MAENVIKPIQSFVSSIIHWIRNNKLEFATLVAILFIGAFFRLHRIDEYMTFLGDEGRDVVIVRLDGRGL